MRNSTRDFKDSDKIDPGCSDGELEEWLVTSIKVLTVLKDEDEEVHERIYADFIFDLQRLKKAERITNEDYEEILGNL